MNDLLGAREGTVEVKNGGKFDFPAQKSTWRFLPHNQESGAEYWGDFWVVGFDAHKQKHTLIQLLCFA